MTITVQLQHVMAGLVAQANVHRVGNWSGAIAIRVGGRPWATCAIEAGAVWLSPELPARTTVDVSSARALERWLVDGVDYTHLVAAGDFVVTGDYFDLLLISKVLGLRPDRRAENR